jgi:hypothetical protein
MAPKTLPSDAETWEAYRLYQRDVLLACAQDADLLIKRAHGALTDADRALVVSLLWDKRCQPWKFYRDEQRALLAIRR